MKLLTLFAFLLTCGSLWGQPIHKKTTKIIIENDLTADDNYKITGQSIIANDLEIKSSNKDFGSIVTEELTLTKLGIKMWYYFKITTTKNKITISAKWAGDENALETSPLFKEKKTEYREVYYNKKPKSFFGVIFAKMELIANEIEGNKSYK